eukprot:TRINITY_DN5101_c0_g1_i3.p1 TRINITY_DN5101_c0_g1~~TRINITY_DN5101_c0_g1_i3.p1  ORF type:complete len:623 (+),score=129.06 TRINITY_DN5101_c0_g1_i3:76-1944(+)
MPRRRIKPAWDSTVSNLDAHKLSKAELARRKQLYESKNAINAQKLIEEQRLRRRQQFEVSATSPENSSFERARLHRKQAPRVISSHAGPALNASPYKQQLLDGLPYPGEEADYDDFLDHPDNSRLEEYQDELHFDARATTTRAPLNTSGLSQAALGRGYAGHPLPPQDNLHERDAEPLDMGHYEQLLQQARQDELDRQAEAAQIYQRVSSWARSQSNPNSSEHDAAPASHTVDHAGEQQDPMAAAKQQAAQALQSRVDAIHRKLDLLTDNGNGVSSSATHDGTIPLNQTGAALLQLLDSVTDHLTKANAEQQRLAAKVDALEAQLQAEKEAKNSLLAQLEGRLTEQSSQHASKQASMESSINEVKSSYAGMSARVEQLQEQIKEMTTTLEQLHQQSPPPATTPPQPAQSTHANEPSGVQEAPPTQLTGPRTYIANPTHSYYAQPSTWPAGLSGYTTTVQPTLPDHLQMRPTIRPSEPVAAMPVVDMHRLAPQRTQSYPLTSAYATATSTNQPERAASNVPYVSPLKEALQSAAKTTGLPPQALIGTSQPMVQQPSWSQASVHRTTPATSSTRTLDSNRATSDAASVRPVSDDPLDAVFDRLRQSGVQLASSIGTRSNHSAQG